MTMSFRMSDALGALLRLVHLTQRTNVPSQAALIADIIHGIVIMTNGLQDRMAAGLSVHGRDMGGPYQLTSCCA